MKQITLKTDVKDRPMWRNSKMKADNSRNNQRLEEEEGEEEEEENEEKRRRIHEGEGRTGGADG